MKYKLELKDVSYVYGAKTPFEAHALNNINLAIEEGSVTGIIGHTGSGKSTLVRLLNGLERPSSGTVLLDGKDIWAVPKEIGKIRFRVGLVMQYPEYQLFEETVSADIAFGPKNMGLDSEEINERVVRYSALVGLDPSVLEKSPFELSGGQKRRVAIAGIMAMKPEILVLDEPAAGLDPEGRKNIFDAIEEYRRTENATVIIVSHSMEDMAERCDRIAVLGNGVLLAEGDTASVFSEPHILLDAGLDVPEITRIAMMLADRGYKTDGAIYTVDQAADFLCKLIGGGCR
ncbi:MAG: energy-coupling factor transporter ATPase [Clostridia bacterium]|nr:energy-coupling factor transporter ATPase [Clostridia bacterium]